MHKIPVLTKNILEYPRFGLGCMTQADRSLLFVACERGETETAQLLIDKGAKVNHCDKVGFHLVC